MANLINNGQSWTTEQNQSNMEAIYTFSTKNTYLDKNIQLKVNINLPHAEDNIFGTIPMPEKGQIITMNLNGTNKQYRVLKVNDTIAEVLAMYEYSTSQTWKSSYSSNKVTFSNNKSGQKYDQCDLDIALNSNFYNTLSSEAKIAIVAKNLTQDIWYWSNSGDPDYTGTYGTSVPGTSTYTISNANGTYPIGDRNIYALSVQDVIDYLNDENMRVDKTAILRNQNTWKMFWNTETKPTTVTQPWLRSANADYSSGALSVSGRDGRLFSSSAYDTYAARPAFQIDLSKVSWEVSE